MQRFHPRHRNQRYCGEGCREAARKWSRWKRRSGQQTPIVVVAAEGHVGRYVVIYGYMEDLDEELARADRRRPEERH
jgi:hypothetical protein